MSAPCFRASALNVLNISGVCYIGIGESMRREEADSSLSNLGKKLSSLVYTNMLVSYHAMEVSVVPEAARLV
jgi:hypothetical protein